MNPSIPGTFHDADEVGNEEDDVADTVEDIIARMIHMDLNEKKDLKTYQNNFFLTFQAFIIITSRNRSQQHFTA